MPFSFVSSLLVFHPLALINLQTRRFLLNYTPPPLLLPLSVSWWIGYITALDYMTVCRPKSFLCVCTQQTQGMCEEGALHSSSSSCTHTPAHAQPPTAGSCCTHTHIYPHHKLLRIQHHQSHSLSLHLTSATLERDGGGETTE